ncbi:uncharacterized protein I303_101563 [Kwoniella dejecticola CBS 10117]|uniref:F-box domain-containing protein n=1 Tax=Kwoniella dejecticola CBS 10117 TaxID=1296121 RepID=A0A1A6ADE6_9TREE|nr:uncharacterized protein I303_02305 [Kwoniella dejecticola CBS 10117]OBR88086.1 hypothetical protein I303_02305 [Kwoniella dejecticola CBS 10117]
MDITHLPPSRILTYHSHLSNSLLPSALSKDPSNSYSASSTSSSASKDRASSRCQYHHHYQDQGILKQALKRNSLSLAPRDGASPFSTLPTEIALSILSYLDLPDILTLSRASRRLHELTRSPALYRELMLNELPAPIPISLERLILPAVRDLTLQLHYHQYRNTPLRTLLYRRKPNIYTHTHTRVPSYRFIEGRERGPSILEPLLKHIKLDQLTSLKIPFSSSYLPLEDLFNILDGLGANLRKLDLRGSNLNGHEWMKKFERFSKLENLDLAFTNIHSLPPPSTFKNLKVLSLSSCCSISPVLLSAFLGELPPTIEKLDLSRLEQIPFRALWDMRVICPRLELGQQGDTRQGEGLVLTRLREIKLVGIDHLTRRDIRGLRKHWEDQRKECIHKEQTEFEFELSNDLPGLNPCEWDMKEPRTPEMVSRSSSPTSSSTSTSSSGDEEELRTPSTSYSQTPRTPPPRVRNSPDQPQNRKITLPSQHTFLQSLSTSTDHLFDPHSATRVRYLTDLSVKSMERNRACLDEQPDAVRIDIIHSAILESEDEDGYRQFIGEVVGGTLDVGIGGGGYVEID